jgi:hypothetical protein
MKKMLSVFAFLLLMIVVTACRDQLLDKATGTDGGESSATRATDFKATDYYLYRGEKIPLQKMDEKFHVVFHPADANKVRGELTRAGATLGNMEVKTSDDTENFTGYTTAIIEGKHENVVAALSHARYWSPYYKFENGEEMYLSDMFTVIMKPETTLSQLEELAKEYSVKMIGIDKDTPTWYDFACTNLSKGNALEMANLFYESGLFENAFPDFVAKITFDCINEPTFQNGELWHLGNTTSLYHINYCNSRTVLAQGSSSVTVAIIDDGVQSNHPDLYNVLPGMNANDTISPYPNYGDISGNTSFHGTMIAGFIGAIPNNNQGVAGIAYGVTILPVSLNKNSLGKRVKAALYYAADRAQVINCSWHYSRYNQYISEGIDYALAKDCVVVFASGNSDSNQPVNQVTYPANSDPRLLVVGSINKNGAKAATSCYGDELDIVAPGENVVSIFPGNGSMIAHIGGTSYAAPQVAAVAAMVRSLLPTLNNREVNKIVEKTARKITTTYPATTDKPWGWNNQYGSGLLDAYAALANAACIKEVYQQTITSNTTVIGCAIKASSSNTVSGGARLTMKAARVFITGSFRVQAGSSLTIANS